MRRTPVRVYLCALVTLTAALACPMAGAPSAHAAPAPGTPTTIVPPSPTPIARGMATSTVVTGAPATGTPVVATPGATRIPIAAATTVTPTLSARAGRTVAPRPTPDPHPGYGAVPWRAGEYSVWTISGHDIVRGTAYQLFTLAGHQWIDSSAYTVVQQPQFAISTTTTSASRTAFDVNTYLLRRYDDVSLRQPNNPDDKLDAPLGSVLHATLFGPHLDYTSYQSYGHAGCIVARGRTAPANTVAYGMMSDLLRTITPHPTGTYPVLDPYGPHPTATASYTVLGRETVATIFGKVVTIHVRFHEGTQPPLEMWYTATPAHVVVKWGIRGQFGAVLTHYERSSVRTALPVPLPQVPLPHKSLACA